MTGQVAPDTVLTVRHHRGADDPGVATHPHPRATFDRRFELMSRHHEGARRWLTRGWAARANKGCDVSLRRHLAQSAEIDLMRQLLANTGAVPGCTLFHLDAVL